MRRVVVLGSINRDRIVRCRTLPSPGETVVASSSDDGHGGKGANQACACARLGANTAFLAAVGEDPAGVEALKDLDQHGVNVDAVAILSGQRTGNALVVVDGSGENFIIIEPGANAHLTAGMATDALDKLHLSAADVLLTSAEVSLDTLAAAAARARAVDAAHIHNLAPYHRLSPWTAGPHLVLVANAGEARQATGLSDPAAAAAELANGRRAALVTIGGDGAVLAVTGEEPRLFAPPEITVADTTGAGDAFCGAFAAALSMDMSLDAATDLAVRAGAFAVTGVGARGALATMAQLRGS